MADRLADAILVARNIVSELEKKASQTGGLTFPISMHDVLDVIEKLGGLHGIVRKPKNMRHEQLSSMLVRYENQPSLILYSSTLNLCFKRFCVCKEAVHLMMDTEPSQYTEDVIDLIQQLITGVSISPNTPIESEYFAVLVALEVLVPYHMRQGLDELLSNGAKTYDLALQCRVPEKYISLLFNSKYQQVSTQINKDLAGE